MLRQSEPSLAKIAATINRSNSTISRELRRNQSPPGEYWPDTAQALTLARKMRLCRIDRDHVLKEFITTKLCCHYWSPEAIAGWLKCQQKAIRGISHESIYAWIYQLLQKRINCGNFWHATKLSVAFVRAKALEFRISLIEFRFMTAQKSLIVNVNLAIGREI